MRQGVEQEGLLEDRAASVLCAGVRGLGISGHEQHVHARMQLTQTAREFAATEIGHDDVGQEQFDGLTVLAGDSQGILAVVGEQHGIALALEKFASEATWMV